MSTITINLPEETQHWDAGNSGYPLPPEWLYLDLDEGEVAASSLPPGNGRSSRPDWMSHPAVVELAELPPNLASLEPVRNALEGCREELEQAASAWREHGSDWQDYASSAIAELRVAVQGGLAHCAQRISYFDAITDYGEEVAALEQAGDLDAYVRGFNAGGTWTPDEEIRGGIAEVVRFCARDSDDAEDRARAIKLLPLVGEGAEEGAER